MLATEAEMRHIRGNSIAMVFQEPTTSLNPVLTVKRQISESLELHRNMDKMSHSGNRQVIKTCRYPGC